MKNIAVSNGFAYLVLQISMNILFYFISQINPRCGGTERVADNVAHGLRARGHKVYYLSRTKVAGDYDIPCCFLPDETGVTQANIDYINGLCEEKHIDVIINEAGNTDDIYLINRKNIPGVRIITELHFSPMQAFRYYYRSTHLPLTLKHPVQSAVNILKWIKTPFNRRLHWRNMVARYRYMYANSHTVVVLSPAYIKDFSEIAGLEDASRLVSIYNPNTFASSAVCPAEAKENMVLAIGRLDFSPKKIDYLLKIWARVQIYHSDWRLCVCGDGPARESLERLVKRRRIGGVSFEGNVNPLSYYERASIMCMTSIYEGTPMVIVEAMQMGCIPIVYDTYTAARDMITDGVDGYVVEPFHKDKYASRLSALMDDAALRSKMSVKAKASVHRFDLERIIDEWEHLLEV